jgi:hypothetical protein
MTPQNHRIKDVLAVAATLVAPGSAHLFFGEKNIGAGIITAVVIGRLAESYFELLGPWTMIAVGVLNFAFLIGISFHAVNLGRRSRILHRNAAIIGAFVLIALAAGTRHWLRVQNFKEPSDSMAPAVVAGDVIAVDQRPGEYHLQDLVAVYLPANRSTVIRRISSLDPGTATLVLDKDPSRPVALVSQADLRGKVIYVFYSLEPKSFRPRWDRFLTPIH